MAGTGYKQVKTNPEVTIWGSDKGSEKDRIHKAIKSILVTKGPAENSLWIMTWTHRKCVLVLQMPYGGNVWGSVVATH